MSLKIMAVLGLLLAGLTGRSQSPADLRTLNLSIEKGAWGAFRTEFYPTYDYMPIWRSGGQ